MQMEMEQPGDSDKPARIYINPKFKKAYINPNFLLPSSTTKEATIPTGTIHLNPVFLARFQSEQPKAPTEQPTPVKLNPEVYISNANPIITNTRRKLIRLAVTTRKPAAVHPGPPLAPLVKISKNKLVRPGVVPVVQKSIKVIAVPDRKSLKLDRRQPRSLELSFVKRYALSRRNGIKPVKIVVTDRRLLKLHRNATAAKGKHQTNSKTVAYASKNKKLVLVNINGVLYRSSNNKLQKSVTSGGATVTSPGRVRPVRGGKAKEHFLVIRGTRFVLDYSGTKLRKVSSSDALPATTMKRIDIGGLTYRPRTDGTFVRTNSHETRNHLSTAKQRSIQLLASQRRKCNIPCPIFRRLGKCLAHSRGKCPKVHDPKHVTICPRFLKGECTESNCLLSHHVSLEKMPVCQFFLEGRCVRPDCPYLHRKVSEKNSICENFINGFCPLANKCPNRHIFLCPDFERNGRCERSKCPYPHGRRKPEKRKKVPPVADGKVNVDAAPLSNRPVEVAPVRYYLDGDRQTANDTGELSASEKVQLNRMLAKVEKMKGAHQGSEPCGSGSERQSDDSVVRLPENQSPEKQEKQSVISDDSDDDRPLFLRRKKLGTLPAFIPI